MCALCIRCIACSEVGIIPRAIGDLFASRTVMDLQLSLSVVGVLHDRIHDLLSDAILRAVRLAATVSHVTVEKTRVRSVALTDELQTLGLLRAVLSGKRDQHVIVMVTVTRAQVTCSLSNPVR